MSSSTKRGARDDDRIDTGDERERWAAKLGVTKAQLKAAIDAVGPRADDVERYLRDRAEASRSA